MMRRWIVCMAALCLVGCAGASQSNVVATPTVAPIRPAATPTTLAERVQTRLVSDEPVFSFHWEPDGRMLVYAQSERCPTGCKTNWYRFDVATGMTTTFEPEIVTIDPQVWNRLTDSRNSPPRVSPRKDPNVSPSKKWVIYSRVSPVYTPVPCPKGPCFSPMELWLARVSGSDPIKVSDLGSGEYCIAEGWFDAENKVVLDCGYEGMGRYVVADLKNRSMTNLDDVVGEHIVSLEGAILSPDGTRLAVKSLASVPVNLLVVSLDGSSIMNIGQGIAGLQWSSDGQRLYYLQRLKLDQCASAVIRVHDFSIDQDKIVLGPEVVLSSKQRVTLDTCDHSFLISPAEDAALLVLGEAGSWIVDLH